MGFVLRLCQFMAISQKTGKHTTRAMDFLRCRSIPKTIGRLKVTMVEIVSKTQEMEIYAQSMTRRSILDPLGTIT